ESGLALCDLAGSERCSRTHNTGERLKEAGNINSSLLTLGKCINAMRLNQHSKFQHHVPFRESKLTHFLQFFFCGAGRVSMVVNINQSASCFDETLNVLKFSALAQKVNTHTNTPENSPSSICGAVEREAGRPGRRPAQVGHGAVDDDRRRRPAQKHVGEGQEELAGCLGDDPGGRVGG
uniref:Kinesin motor domain-containing protein n=1 Tax=Seriola lalandi dorsalis TaxID=1841481 RepID=A0A3B4XI38_SERLL